MQTILWRTTTKHICKPSSGGGTIVAGSCPPCQELLPLARGELDGIEAVIEALCKVLEKDQGWTRLD